MKKLKLEEILTIPDLKNQGQNVQTIAATLGVHPQAIHYWIRKLRDKKYEIKQLPKGRKPLEIPEPDSKEGDLPHPATPLPDPSVAEKMA